MLLDIKMHASARVVLQDEMKEVRDTWSTALSVSSYQMKEQQHVAVLY